MTTIFRPGKYDVPFAVLPNAPVNDPEMTFAAKAILWYLISKPADWRVNQTDIEKSSPAGQHVVRNAVNELIEKGYIDRFRQKRDDGTFEWIHHVYPLPEYNPSYKSPGETREGLSTDGSSTRGSATSGESQLLQSNDVQSNDVQKNEEQMLIFDERDLTTDSQEPSIEALCEQLWTIYPNKKGKARAFECIQARLRQGRTFEELLQATENYARLCKKRSTEKRYILHGPTFYGVHEDYRDYLDPNTDRSSTEIVDQDRTRPGGYVDVTKIKRPT